MTFYRDETNDCLIIDDISEGFEILPTSLYQGYLKKIKDLEKQNKDLQAELRYTSHKLADALSAQAEAIKQREDNEVRMHEIIRATAESERSKGIAIGYTCGMLSKDDNEKGISYELAKRYWYQFDKFYSHALDTGVIDKIDADYERSLAMDTSRHTLVQKDKP